jgi:hypothetical protein
LSETQWEGEAAFLVQDTVDPDDERTDSVFAIDGSRVLRVEKDVFSVDRATGDETETMHVVYDPGFLRFDAAWLEEGPGFEQTENYDRTETSPGSDPDPARGRSHIFTVESVSETLTVDAGTFRGCLRVRRTRN